MIKISEELFKKLIECAEARFSIFISDDSAGYNRCGFCYETSGYYKQDINHHKNCEGIHFL